jgi:hypothetical protein
MEDKILERLRKEFDFVGDEKISGKTAMKIVTDVVNELQYLKRLNRLRNMLMSVKEIWDLWVLEVL